MIIVNFSHPIVENESLERVTGSTLDQIEITDHMLHLDLESPLVPQVEEAVARAIAVSSETSDVRLISAIRLPGFADDAVLVVDAFRTLGHIPKIIRFARTDTIPPRFDAVEIINLGEGD